MVWVKLPVQEQWQNAVDANASGYVLKTYLPGTTTPTPLAVDSQGSTLVGSVTFNANGVPEVSGNEVALYIDREFKYAIYENQADADADDNPFYGPIDNVKLYADADAVAARVVSSYSALRVNLSGSVYESGDPVTVASLSAPGINGVGTILTAAGAEYTDNGMTTITANGATSTAGMLVWVRTYNSAASASWAGALGDGSTDDHAALLLSLQSGLEIDLDHNRTYIINQPIIFTLSSPLRIRGNGSTIKLVSSTIVNDAVYLIPDGHDIYIEKLRIDATQDAFRCLHIRNESNTTIKDVDLVDVTCENAYRSSTDFQGGDGILVRGGFARVNIIRPVIRNIHMASGAGISGSEGISGISISRNFAATLDIVDLRIEHPYIDNISSDVDTYYQDQDGIKMLGLDPASGEIAEGSSSIVGGVFKNCWGRSIKVQRNDCSVTGSKFYRDTGFDTGYGNTEIDFQFGSGQVSDIHCNYKGFNPTTIVNSTSGNRKQAGFYVDGITCALDSTVLDCAVQRFRGSTPQQGSALYVKNVSIEGSTVHMVRYDTNVATGVDPTQYAVIENCYADDITTAFLRIRGSGNFNNVTIRNVADRSNTGTPLLEENISGNAAEATLEATGVYGMVGGDSDGSWTANLEFGGASTGVAYSARVGLYQKQGLWVTATLLLVLSNKGSATGAATITGLPFDVAAGTQAYAAVTLADVRNVTYTGQVQAWAVTGGDSIIFNQTTEAGVYSALTDANFANNTELILTLRYKTDTK